LENTFKLIDGTIKAEEAKELLINLYSDKILFHSRKSFSMQERFGHPDEASLKLIPELKNTLNDIGTMLNQLQNSTATLHIQANIVIKAKDESK
jgi:hypothetical protein